MKSPNDEMAARFIAPGQVLALRTTYDGTARIFRINEHGQILVAATDKKYFHWDSYFLRDGNSVCNSHWFDRVFGRQLANGDVSVIDSFHRGKVTMRHLRKWKKKAARFAKQ